MSVELSESRGVSPKGGSIFLLIGWLLATMSLWFFAFYHIPEGVPEWVRRAQVACFGSNESGLPGASGWLLLILSPAMFLGAIFLAFGDEISLDITALIKGSSGRIFILLLGGLLVIEIAWVSFSIWERVGLQDQIAITGGSLPESYPQGSEIAPDFSLIDQNGDKVTLSAFHGKPVLLSFIFAHCKAVCPTLIRTAQTVAKDLPADSVKILLVTLDPWRDSPAVLPGLAKEWELGSNTHLLSGKADEVNAVLDAYHVPRERDKKNGDVFHPALVYLIGANGQIGYSFNNPSVDWIKEGLRRLNR